MYEDDPAYVNDLLDPVRAMRFGMVVVDFDETSLRMRAHFFLRLREGGESSQLESDSVAEEDSQPNHKGTCYQLYAKTART